jgi:hypothetical protein
MKTSLLLLSGSIAGTVAMTIFLLLPRWLGRVHVDVIQAGGSLVVGSDKRSAFPAGFAMGIGFAFAYSAFLSLSALPFNALTGLLLGSLRGVIAMLVSIVIMQHHPDPLSHDRGPSTGLAQLGATCSMELLWDQS